MIKAVQAKEKESQEDPTKSGASEKPSEKVTTPHNFAIFPSCIFHICNLHITYNFNPFKTYI